ncbi:MAG: lysylphosphatidylglycerol synthase transmembrane domain-containing protein [Chloroflexota bacterium]
MAKWRLGLGLAISLVFLYWLSSQVRDLDRVLAALSEAQYIYVLPALAAYFLGVWVRAIRWHYLLKPVREVSASQLFPVVVIGYMANNILPARIGEFVRAYVLGERAGISKTATLGTIVVERLCDGLALLSFMLMVALVVPFGITLQQIAWVTAALFLGMLAALALFAARPDWAERLVGLALRPLPPRYAAPLARLAAAGLSGLRALRSARVFGTAFALSLLAWLCEAAMYYLIALGFFPWLGAEAILLTVAVANVGAMIPSSPGYIGTFDALAVFALGLFGVAGELALGYTAVLHAALILPVTLLGFFFLWRENLTLSTLTRTPLRASLPADGSLD